MQQTGSRIRAPEVPTLGPWLSAPVAVRPHGVGLLEIAPLGSLPKELNRLGASPDGLCEAFVGHDGRAAVKIYVGVVLPTAQRMLLDARATVRLDDGSIYF